MLRRYKIFSNPLGTHVAVKIGWSWPAFFFGCIWTLLKQLWMVATGVILMYMLMSAGTFHPEAASILTFVIWVVLGVKGNELVGTNLVKRGYTFKGVSEGSNKEAAISGFILKENNT